MARQKKIKIIHQLQAKNASSEDVPIKDEEQSEEQSFYAISKKGVRAKSKNVGKLHSMRLSYSHYGMENNGGERGERKGKKQNNLQAKQNNPETEPDAESSRDKTDESNKLRCRSKKQGKTPKNRFRRTFHDSLKVPLIL